MLNVRSRSVAFLFLNGLICGAAWAQAGKSAPAPPVDSLGRSTPRGTVLRFFGAARKGDLDTAASYLNTRKKGENAAKLADQLFVVLDRRFTLDVSHISDRPEGSLAYPGDPTRDLVGTIATQSGNFDIQVERIDRGTAGAIWLFSSKTLASIPDIYTEVNEIAPGTVLPQWMVTAEFLGIPLFHWFAVLVCLPLLYFVSGLLNLGVSALAGMVRRILRKRHDLPNPECLPRPVRFLLLALLIRWAVSVSTLSLLARLLWSTGATILTIASLVWLAIRTNGWLERRARTQLGRGSRSGAISVLRFGRRLADVFAVIVGVLVALHVLGVNVATAVAGLGIGGIAVALAAQKTLENVIGGISLVLDQTVKVGEFLKVGDVTGAIEEIGLRSIRLRTSDRTLVSVPNGQVASVSLENFSLRDKFWFHHILGLSYETTADQLRSVLAGIARLLSEHPAADRDSVRASFLRFGTSSFEIEMFAHFYAEDMGRFFALQENLLLRIMDIVQSCGARIAIPTQALYVAPKATNGAARPEPETVAEQR